MPLGNYNLQFQNQNAQRSYPLAETGSRVDQTGEFKIPDDFILFLDLPVHAGLNVAPAQFFIMNVGAFATGYSVVVGYQPATSGAPPVAVATALIASQIHVRGTVYALGGIGDFSDTVGQIVIGNLASIEAQPPGFWTFNFDNTQLDPDAVRPIIRGVSSLICVNGDQVSTPLQGDIELSAGNNCQLVPILVSGQNPVIQINFIQGEGSVEQCVCTGDSAPTTPITTVSGVAPTQAGNFSLVGSDCIQITPIANGLQITDVCAQPCCGCTELESITSDLERLGQEAQSVQDFVLTRLQASVDAMDMVVLGARLGDGSCIQCE